MRKAIDLPTDHKSDYELDKGRQTQVIVRQDNDGIKIISRNMDKSLNSEHDTEMIKATFNFADRTTRLVYHVGDMIRFPMYKGQVEE